MTSPHDALPPSVEEEHRNENPAGTVGVFSETGIHFSG
jgi:hypothetical protein